MPPHLQEAFALKSTNVQKRNILLIIFALLAVVFIACALSSCASTDDEQRIIEDGYVHLVTYEANGGDFNPDAPGIQDSMQVRVRDNSLTVTPGYRPAGAGDLDIIRTPVRDGYTLTGWVIVELDEEGNVISSEDWSFTSDRVTGDITLRAMWLKDTTLYLNAILDDGTEVNFREYSVEQGASFISSLYSMQSDGTYSLTPDNIAIVGNLTANGRQYTALSFYWLDESNNRVPLTVENAVFAQDAEEMTVYAEVIEGRYTMVTQELVDEGSLNLRSDSYWYLLEDIDFGQSYSSGGRNYTSALSTFSGSIIGNGNTISGIWVRSQVSTRADDILYSIFGEMSGRIEDVTFSNVELTVFAPYSSNANRNSGLSIALLASSFGENGVFDGVTLDNCKISIVNSVVGENGETTVFTYSVAENKQWTGTPVLEQNVTGGDGIAVEVKSDIDM